MKDKQKKKDLIERGIPKDFGIRQYQLYNATGGDFEAVQQQLQNIYGDDYNALKQLQKARKAQNSKVKKHITFLIRQQGVKVYFATFTYSDNWKENPKPEQLKRQVIKALKNAYDYILNIDYGKQGERLHYHAIVAYKDDIDPNQDSALNAYREGTGFLKLQQVKTDESDIKRLTYYINKLTLHSIKVKQTYISTKKGTRYQYLKNEYQRMKKQGYTEYSMSIEKYIQQTEL